MASSSVAKKRKGKSTQTHNEAKFKSLYHEDRFNKYIKHREVLVEAKILIDTNELSPISEQINKRKWQRLTKPLQAVGYTMMREFYANAWVMESERHLPLPYTSMIRGKKINFSPGEIHKVLNLRKKPLPNVVSYHDRKNENDLRMNDILRDLCVPRAQWVMHDDGRPHFLRRTDLQPMARGWYEFVTRSIIPTTNRSEVNAERAMLLHSIIIGEDIQVDEIIAEQIYKFINKKGIKSKLPFPGVIQHLCNEAKASIPKDTMISMEPPISAKLMERVRGERTTTRQAPPPQEEEEDAEMPQAPQVQQEQNRKSFSDINTRLDTMDHQLNFLCNNNQFMNEDLLYPYQQTELTMRNMQGRGIPITLENLKINRQREEEMRIERQRYQRILDEVAAQRAKEQNKEKARRDEDEDDDDDDDEDEDED
ncbi:hypothetical protein PIB30_090315 [Stylosanthes scabra]|uniref:Putative plant transposon protein domain-containing protein n=1 Tax=Stylosanthes scabra TaxID=79078 RepID=A0ABU6RU63_9FABA|nr:hypothetical protein [Stylosanthes scabra]